MTERDSDIEFDFFEDLEPAEPPPTEQPSRGPRPPGGPRRRVRGPTGVTPLLRLTGLIAFAILVVVLLVFWVQSCSGASKTHAYESYMAQATTVGRDSTQIGNQLTTVLTTPGLKPAQLQARINGLAQRMEQVRAAAAQLRPPGRLQGEQQSLEEALAFRVAGLRGLAAAFSKTTGSKDVNKAGLALATQANRLVAGDVVWTDLFRQSSLDELQRQGITGVAVPTSIVVVSPTFGSPSYWVPIVQRISGAATGGTSGGLHGTGIVSTSALPSGQTLSETTDNTVTAGTNLGFAVVVKNTGDSQEVQIVVTLTIEQQPTPIVKTATIPLINPGEEKTATFTGFNNPPPTYATRTTVKVDVKPVPHEASTSNNSAAYPVIFSLG